MRLEVNWNRFEISLWGKISLWWNLTSLSAFTGVQAKWNSLRYKFHFGQFDQSRISNRSENAFTQTAICIFTSKWKILQLHLIGHLLFYSGIRNFAVAFKWPFVFYSEITNFETGLKRPFRFFTMKYGVLKVLPKRSFVFTTRKYEI